jgi:hypothetical protein
LRLRVFVLLAAGFSGPKKKFFANSSPRDARVARLFAMLRSLSVCCEQFRQNRGAYTSSPHKLVLGQRRHTVSRLLYYRPQTVKERCTVPLGVGAQGTRGKVLRLLWVAALVSRIPWKMIPAVKKLSTGRHKAQAPNNTTRSLAGVTTQCRFARI